jgi:hypothetical protein
MGPQRYEDAVRAGLVLKNQFPHFDIKVREGLTDGEQVSGMTVTTTANSSDDGCGRQAG